MGGDPRSMPSWLHNQGGAGLGGVPAPFPSSFPGGPGGPPGPTPGGPPGPPPGGPPPGGPAAWNDATRYRSGPEKFHQMVRAMMLRRRGGG